MKKAVISFLLLFIVAGFLNAGPGYTNPAREGREYMHSGMDAMREGRYEEAIEMFERAHDIFKEEYIPEGMGKALRKIGWANHVLSRYDEALENYKKALEIFSGEGSEDWKAFLLDDIGSVYFILGKYDDALKYHLEASELYRTNRWERGRAKNLIKTGEVYFVLGRFQEALKNFEEARDLLLEDGDEFNAAKVMGKIGNVYYATGPFEEALKNYNRAIQIFKEADQPSLIAKVQRNIGRVHRLRGEYHEALASFEAALEAFSKLGQPYLEARELRSLGKLYIFFGRYDKALDYHKKSIKIFKELNMPHEIARNYNYIGRIYLVLGKYDMALEHIQAALEILRKTNNRVNMPKTLNHMGEVYRFLGQHDESLKYYREALDLLKEQRQPALLIKTYNQVGRVYFSMRNYEKAEIFFMNAERERENAKLKNGKNFGIVDINIATGRYEEAGKYLAGMKPRWSHTDPYRVKYHNRLGFALRGMGRLNEASKEFLKSITLIEEMRQRLSGGKVSFFRGGKTKVYRALVSTLAERALRKEGEDRTFAPFGKSLESAAFYFSESTKARALLESMAESHRGKAGAHIPSQLRQKEQSLTHKLSLIDSDWELAYKQGEHALKELKERKRMLTEQFNSLVKKLRDSYSRYAALHYPNPLPPENLPLRDNEVLLEYSLGRRAGYLFVVRKGGVKRLIKLPVKGKALKEKVRNFLEPINAIDFKDFSVKRANELYQILLSEAFKEIKRGEKIIIVPDGILGLIPFEALVTKKGKGIKDSVYVGDRYIVSYYQSATVLALQRTLKDVQAKRILFALGNPIYHKKDFRYTAFKQGKTRAAVSPKDREKFAFRSLSAGKDWKRTKKDATRGRELLYPPLFETETEVREIAEIFNVKPNPPDVLLGVDASETSLLKAPLHDYRYIHFATHADSLGNVQGVQEPFILLGQVENDKKDDGFLTLSEVLGLNLDAEIVALSACVTGRGQVMEGEGVANFARAFQHAGARSILVSLWEVASMQAVDYMKSYYRHIKAGKSRGEALRLARGELKRKNPNPFFWAVFILHGEG